MTDKTRASACHLSVRLHGMRVFVAAEVVRLLLGKTLPRGGWIFLFCCSMNTALCKGTAPSGPPFKETSMFLGVGGDQLPLQNNG